MHIISRRSWRLVLLMALSGLVGSGAAFAQAVPEGAYTHEQAQRGKLVFQAQCAACHGTSLVDRFADYTTALKFFHFISGAMPRHAPGSLEQQEYVDLVAYFLELTEFPTGSAELTADRTVLENIRIRDLLSP